MFSNFDIEKMKQMKYLVTILVVLGLNCGYAQDDKANLLVEKKANNYVFEGNQLVGEDAIAAEMEYRKALSKQQANIAGNYNLGNSYYTEGNYEEALYRHQQAANFATTKSEKHKAFHNIGNTLMKNKQCKAAVEAYKNALRNNPNDEETRYNLGLAKACAKQQEDENKNDDKKDDKDKEDKDNSDDKKDENKENKDENKNDNDKENKDENKNDEGENKDEQKNPEDKKDENKNGDKKEEQNQQPQPKPGQLSPQQIKSLLEAMNNQEQKVQEKINAEKQKGIKIKTEKDW